MLCTALSLNALERSVAGYPGAGKSGPGLVDIVLNVESMEFLSKG